MSSQPAIPIRPRSRPSARSPAACSRRRPGGDLSYGTLKRGFREALRRDPLDSLAAVVLGGSYLFYLAEKGQNPKVESFWDALDFITTSLSVGLRRRLRAHRRGQGDRVVRDDVRARALGRGARSAREREGRARR